MTTPTKYRTDPDYRRARIDRAAKWNRDHPERRREIGDDYRKGNTPRQRRQRAKWKATRALIERHREEYDDLYRDAFEAD